MAGKVKQNNAKKQKRKKWTDLDREKAVAVYIQTGSLSAAARAVGAAVSTVKSWVEQQPPDDIENERMKQRLNAVREAWKVVNLYLTHLQKQEVVDKTGAKDSAIVVGTMVDKIQVLLGEPQKHEIAGPNGGPIPVKLYDFDQSKYPDPE